MIFSEEVATTEDVVVQQNGMVQIDQRNLPDFTEAVMDAAFKAAGVMSFQDDVTKKNFHATAFYIHPSGFLVAVPHTLPFKKVRLTESPLGEYACQSVSRISQYGITMMKIGAREPIPSVRFGNSTLLNRTSRVFSVSNLHGMGLYLRRGFFDCRQPTRTEVTEIEKALTLDILVDEGACGSAVFNQEGKVIGIIGSIINVGKLPLAIAIPTEEFLPTFKKIANTVTLYGIKLDMETQEDDGKDELIVSAIGEHSALTKFDIKVGDKITKLGEWEIKCETDFWLSQLAWCMENYNEPVPITLTRKDIETPLTVKIPWTEEKLQGESNPPENLKRGLQITVVKKDTEDILFSGRTESLAGPGMTPNTKCELTGFLKIFREGTYAFHLGVPGTGTLKIGEQFVVEKDKKHPKMRVTGRGFFTQGLYRFSLTLDINETVTEPFVMVETPLDFIESNLPSPLSDDWIFCEDK
jgi:S1-C subfamily serine protease